VSPIPDEGRGTARTLGIPPYWFARPLWKYLSGNPRFNIEQDLPANLAIALRNHTIHAALLSPIDYARDYSMYRVVPRRGISSRGRSGALSLRFASGLRSIRSIAVNPAFTSEIVLCRLVLAERFDLHPTFIPIPKRLSTLHRSTDATLLVATSDRLPTDEGLDLVEEWEDITGLPFLHTMWVSRESELSGDDIDHLINVVAESDDRTAGDDFSLYSDTLGEEQGNALAEFLRMAYYYGVLSDIADIKFHLIQ
jgi:predicted solute-binding protein